MTHEGTPETPAGVESDRDNLASEINRQGVIEFLKLGALTNIATIAMYVAVYVWTGFSSWFEAIAVFLSLLLLTNVTLIRAHRYGVELGVERGQLMLERTFDRIRRQERSAKRTPTRDDIWYQFIEGDSDDTA